LILRSSPVLRQSANCKKKARVMHGIAAED